MQFLIPRYPTQRATASGRPPAGNRNRKLMRELTECAMRLPTFLLLADPNLLGDVLSHVTGQPLTELFQEQIADPLHIDRYYLNLSPNGDPYMGGGIYWLPRDFMKLGQVMLNGGTWNGRRIVSREWARRATSPRENLRKLQYGYLWWSIAYPYKSKTVRAFFAGGNGGQLVMVSPTLIFWLPSTRAITRTQCSTRFKKNSYRNTSYRRSVRFRDGPFARFA